MVKRVRVGEVSPGGSYFASPKADLSFIPSGSKFLDLALGGGWAEGRIANVVGDKSTGKTLICIEAAANFAIKYPKGRIYYREAEAAFDPKYAAALGMPIDRVDFGDPDKALETVEDMYEDILRLVDGAKQPSLYILDSLDALSDRSEMERDMDEGTYGANKAKQMSQLFRRINRKVSQARMTVIIVSQVRAKIGVSFGRTTTRSGGRALDFYASQVVYLSQLGRVVKTVSGIKRPVAIKIKALVDKNKVSLPFREAEFQISFGYGMDDLLNVLLWLKEAGHLADVHVPKDYRGSEAKLKEYVRDLNRHSDKDFKADVAEIYDGLTKYWYEIEQGFLPKRQKYRTATDAT